MGPKCSFNGREELHTYYETQAQVERTAVHCTERVTYVIYFAKGQLGSISTKTIT